MTPELNMIHKDITDEGGILTCLSLLTTRLKLACGLIVYANCAEACLRVAHALVREGVREGEWLVEWCTPEGWKGSPVI